MKRTLVTGACLLLLTGCAAFPFHGSREVSGVQTADALSETWPADAERFASQAALELSRRYPAGQTGLSLVTVPGQFGTSLEDQLRGHGFAIFPSDSSSGVKIGYVLDEIIGEITPTGYLQIRTSDGTAFSMIRKLMGGLPSTTAAPAASVSAPEEPVPGTPVVTPPAHTPEPAPAVKEAPLPEVPQTPVPQTPTPHKEEPSRASGDSRMMPIITAVRTVIPVKWQYSIQGTELRQKQVPYPKNVPWRKALMDMATATDSTVDINAKAKLVTFTPKGTPSAPALANSTAPSQPESPLVATALADAAATSKSAPATTNTLETPATPQVEAAPIPASPAVTIVAEPVSLPEWRLSQGSLRTQLDVWANRASWQLIWNADTDLDMQSRATFRGNFIAAVTQLFEGLHAAGFPLRATFYPSNNVLEVSDR
ncbi:TcpQ domain-containing protein [Bilophila wadsworthia]